MPVIPRQLLGELSQAIQSRLSTASVGLLGPTSEPVQPTVTTTQGPVLPSIPVVPGLTSAVNSVLLPSTTSTVVSTTLITSVTTTSAAPTTTSVAFTTPVVTSSSEIVSTPLPSTSAVLSLTTPVVSDTPEVIQSTSAVIVTPSASVSPTATGVPSNAGSTTQDDGNMSSGIIALIVIGALLAALLAGAFIFRRVQVHRRAKRRENILGATGADSAPFPFTNVSEADLKGAQPIRDPMASYNEKPLPSIIPDVYPALPNPTFNQYGQNQYGQYGDNGMFGPYPAMAGPAMGYGYGQPGRASPAPSQVQAPRMASPSPPPAAYAPGPLTYPNPYPKAPTPALNLPPPSSLAVPQATGGKKRVIQTFQPTLPDELDIHEGDLVTVLHAYDDGWGLCECDGRRGVVPLECLDPGKPDFRASRRFSSLSAIRQ
ncbi:unnamed protein product [Rhizoctonia solani]|uniref:SH3 domain-containing protein n=1 Tax=Rhizoctonia solani TaxID=456999 RepID=A0A8H3BEF4_9AGAM|nr:unnamed protein product [Rhizoctonia solani]